MKKVIIITLFVILTLLVVSCQNNYSEPEFCKKDSDCKIFLTDWPCESIVANKHANIVEDFCVEPCSRGASQQFCEWNYKIPVCENNKCISKVNCQKMDEPLSWFKVDCNSNLEERFGESRMNNGWETNQNLGYWTSFCELYEQC